MTARMTWMRRWTIHTHLANHITLISASNIKTLTKFGEVIVFSTRTNYRNYPFAYSTFFQVSPLPKNRSPLFTNGGGGTSFAHWNVANGAHASTGSRPCQTYENLDFLYRNPPANSAPSLGPPPLPAKSIQRGEPLCFVFFLHKNILTTPLSPLKTFMFIYQDYFEATKSQLPNNI